MTQEEREATNAALLLDENIERRVWEIIEKDPARFYMMLEAAVVAGRYLGLGREIADIVAAHTQPSNPPTTRPPYTTSIYK